MALEDIAMFRAIPGSTVFYPSDAVSCERAVELAANTKGICFIRSSRPATPVIYGANEPFQVGKAKVRTSTCALHEYIALYSGHIVTVSQLPWRGLEEKEGK